MSTPGSRRLSWSPRHRGWLPLVRLHRFAFKYPTLEGSFETHARLAGSSTTPTISLNRGPAMWMYYEDPDKNTIELYYDSGYTEEDIPVELLKELHDESPSAN